MELSNLEQEVMFLKATNELIDSVVNHEVLTFSKGEGGVQARFKGITHQRLFNIILVDFLSNSAREISGDSKSLLTGLVHICESPSFNHNNSIVELRDAVHSFSKWLETEVKVKTWLSPINVEATLTIKREEFIKICGNIGKHNFLKLSVIVKNIKKILLRSNVVVSDEDAILLLSEFYEQFHHDIFSYYGSWIVEQMNNIRWGIHTYLLHEFASSLVAECNSLRYCYTCPHDITKHFTRNCYWELMNDVRTKPPVRKFRIHDIFRRDIDL